MTASTIDKYAILVEILYEKTLDGSQIWSLTSSDDVYRTQIGPYTIHVSEENGREGPDIVVDLFNEEGTAVDRFSDVTLRKAAPRIPGFGTYYLLMRDLMLRAGREATGAEKILNDILSNVGIDPNSAPPIKKQGEDEEIPF